MILPSKYAGMSFSGYIVAVLMPYDSVEDAIDKIVDVGTDEYKGFHLLSTKEHVCVIEIRQNGSVWQIQRASNIRGTVGYERYIKAHITDVELQDDERIVTYRIFMD